MSDSTDDVIDFKNIKLTIELVPRTSWKKNLRSELSKEEWDYLRSLVYERAGYKCEICGTKGELHCHEEWLYNESNQVQTLTKLIALCSACHEVKHIGLAEIKGNYERAKTHLKNINKWSESQAELYIKVSFMKWRHYNKYDWKLNLSLITDWLRKT